MGTQVRGERAGGRSEVGEGTGSRQTPAALKNAVHSYSRRSRLPGFLAYSKHKPGCPCGGHAAQPYSPWMLSSDSHVRAASGLSPLKPERQQASRHTLLGGSGLCSMSPGKAPGESTRCSPTK